MARRSIFAILGVGVFVVILEAASFVGLLMVSRLNYDFTPISPRSLDERHREDLRQLLERDDTYLVFDQSLGWVVGPNRQTSDGRERSNSQGIRADREYQQEPPQDVLRLAAFGDSFTHCDQVENSDTWEEQLSRLSERLEVLNFGVPGYGLDQAYLRYEEAGINFNPDIVFIGFMSENINRVVSVFRPFYSIHTGVPLAKPRFVVEDRKLVRIDCPLSGREDLVRLYEGDEAVFRRLAENDYWYDVNAHRGPEDWLNSVRLVKLVYSLFLRSAGPNGLYNLDYTYKDGSEGLVVTKGLFDRFYRRVLEEGALPIIVLYPNHIDLRRWKNNGLKRYEPLIEYLVARGYRFIDAYEAFDVSTEEKIESYFAGHYSAKGNEAVAQHIFHYLESENLTERKAVQAKAREEIDALTQGDKQQ